MGEETRSQEYAELAAVGPYGVHPGHALITMVEPHPGHEYAYNRWYEDDHYYAGAMAMPWMFAGRRWVATRELQELRYPEKSAIAQPVTAGCYLSTYWITEGRYDDHMKWTVGINRRLNRDGRVYQDRTHVFTAFQDHEATVYRDGAAGPRDYHALDHPYAGLVLQVIDAEEAEQRDELVEWLRSRHLPQPARGRTGRAGDGLPADPAARRPDDVREAGRGGRHPADAAVVPGAGPCRGVGGALRGAGYGGGRIGARARRVGGAVHSDGAGHGPLCGRLRRAEEAAGVRTATSPSARTADQSRGPCSLCGGAVPVKVRLHAARCG